MNHREKIFVPHANNPEGPVLLKSGGWAFTQMNNREVSCVNSDGQNLRTIVKVGLPNGLVRDGDDNLYIADARWRKLLKTTLSGELTEISTGNAGHPFLLPNDLCFGPDGLLYMTDSGIELETLNGIQNPEDIFSLLYDGKLFSIDPATGETRLLDKGLQMANGLCFAPDGKTLYVNESITGNVWAYQVQNGKRLGEKTLLCNVMLKPCKAYGRGAGPDGMAVDEHGNLYIAVITQGDVCIVSPDGTIIDRIFLEGRFPTNLAFDRAGTRTIVVTDAGLNRLVKLHVGSDGFPLYTGQCKGKS